MQAVYSYWSFLLVLIFLSTQTFGQKAEDLGIIVSLQSESSMDQLIGSINNQCEISIDPIVEEWKIYLIKGSCLSLDEIRNLELVKSAQVNGLNYTRDVIPNDSLFFEQNYLNIISMPQAWDITTGGRSPFGHDIVAAALDEDISLDHPDLENNIYVNEGEIPGDGLDNDGNGYIDDYRGYNVIRGNDDHPNRSTSHGSSVASIMGAETDNSIGVAGINWTGKILYLSPVNDRPDAVIMEQMRYVYQMRKKYNESNGAQGAFVVVSNMSFGADEQFVDQFQPLCDLIDSLGSVGILSVAAGPNNRNIDIDQFGDKPNDCPSDYLISVTDSDEMDQLVNGRGFGKVNMDIASPGTGSITTARENSYKSFTGASAAAPQVSGVVSLLYAVDCPEWQNMIIENPRGAAALVKQVILEAADPSNALTEKVSSGGRLNAFAAMQLLREKTCLAGIDENKIAYISKVPDQEFMKVVIEIRDMEDFDFMVFDARGALIEQRKILNSQGPRHTLNLDISSYPVAGYIAVLKSGDKEYNKKFIVTR